MSVLGSKKTITLYHGSIYNIEPDNLPQQIYFGSSKVTALLVQNGGAVVL